jgi:hypothetical protein
MMHFHNYIVCAPNLNWLAYLTLSFYWTPHEQVIQHTSLGFSDLKLFTLLCSHTVPSRSKTGLINTSTVIIFTGDKHSGLDVREWRPAASRQEGGSLSMGHFSDNGFIRKQRDLSQGHVPQRLLGFLHK